MQIFFSLLFSKLKHIYLGHLLSFLTNHSTDLQLKVQCALYCDWLKEGFCTGVRRFDKKKGDVLGLHLDNKWGWVITPMTFFLKSVWAAAEHSDAQSHKVKSCAWLFLDFELQLYSPIFPQ